MALILILLGPIVSNAIPPPPEVVTLDPANAVALGFKVELVEKNGLVSLDVLYPESIDEWDIPQEPRIEIRAADGTLIADTFGIARVQRSREYRPLRFGTNFQSGCNVTVTFWYQGTERGGASKGFRLSADQWDSFVKKPT